MTLLLLAATAAAQATCLKLDGQTICTPSYLDLEAGPDTSSNSSAAASGIRAKQRWLTPYRITQLAVVGGMTADIVSSWGCAEANPLLRSADGRFRTRGTLIKVGVTSGGLALSHLLKRKMPTLERVLTFGLAGTSSVLYATAARNYSMPCY